MVGPDYDKREGKINDWARFMRNYGNYWTKGSQNPGMGNVAPNYSPLGELLGLQGAKDKGDWIKTLEGLKFQSSQPAAPVFPCPDSPEKPGEDPCTPYIFNNGNGKPFDPGMAAGAQVDPATRLWIAKKKLESKIREKQEEGVIIIFNK